MLHMQQIALVAFVRLADGEIIIAPSVFWDDVVAIGIWQLFSLEPEGVIYRRGYLDSKPVTGKGEGVRLAPERVASILGGLAKNRIRQLESLTLAYHRINNLAVPPNSIMILLTSISCCGRFSYRSS